MTELTDFLPENYLSWGDNLEFLLRILLSALFGIIIGLSVPAGKRMPVSALIALSL